MAEQITFPADNSTFTIGNTTYVWDDPPGIWRAYTVGDFSGGGGSGGDPNWIPSFAANSTLVSTGNDFSGTLFTAPADGNGTWGILDTGIGEATTNVPITTTDSNTWGYNPDEGYLSGNTTLISAQLSGNGGSRTAWVYLAPGDSLVFGFRVDRGSYRYVELEAYGAAGGGSTTVNIGGGAGGGGSPVILSIPGAGEFTNDATITTNVAPADIVPGDSAQYQGQQVWDTNVQSAENWLRWTVTTSLGGFNQTVNQELSLNGILINTIPITDTRSGSGGAMDFTGEAAFLVPQAAIDARSGGEDAWTVVTRANTNSSGGTIRRYTFNVTLYTH